MFGHPIFWAPQFLAGLTSILVAFYLWQRRSTPCAKALLVLMIATAEWAFLSALHKVSPDLSTKVLIAKIQYLGIVTVPPALLVFVLQYTGRERWLTARNLILLAILPIITLALAWTNEFHKLIWKRTWIEISGSIPIGVYDYGPCFWIWTSFCYLAVLLSTIWLIQAFISSPRFYRMQFLIMLIGIAAPWVANGLYLLDISPWPRIDLTPISFTVTGLALGCGMFWARILDIVPVAHATVLKSIPDGVIVLDDNKRIVNINPAAQKIFCFSNSGIIGQSALQIFANQTTLIEYLRDVTEVRSEITLGEGDTQRYYDLYISPFKDRQGGLMGRLITLRDFTQHKLAEEALRESEEKYHSIFSSATDTFLIFDYDGNIVDANSQACKMYGYSHDELVGLSGKDIVHPDYRHLFEKFKKDVQEIGEFYAESVGVRKNGNSFSIEVRGGTFLYKSKRHLLAVVRDISNRKKMEDQLQQSQKMEAIGTLAGGVAHDLNNILGGLVSYPELLLLQLPEDSPLRKSILTIQKSGEKAAAVVQDLLTLARRGVVVTEVVNLNDVIAQYLKSPEHEKLQSYHPGVHIETHLEKNTLNILGSSIHLSKTVMNLISNAAEAMPEGGKLTVSTENRYIDRPIRGYDDVKDGDYVVLTVSDTGTGIAPDDI